MRYQYVNILAHCICPAGSRVSGMLRYRTIVLEICGKAEQKKMSRGTRLITTTYDFSIR